MNPLEHLLASLVNSTETESFVWPLDGQLYRREDALVSLFSARAVYVECDTEVHTSGNAAQLRISHSAVAAGPPRARGVIVVTAANSIYRLEHHGALKLSELQKPQQGTPQ